MDCGDRVLHEAGLVGSGTVEGLGTAAKEAIDHPLQSAGKVAAAAVIGGGLSLLQGRLGMLALAGEVTGAAMTAAFSWDVLRRTSEISGALQRSWSSQAEDQQSKQVIAGATGSFLVDGLLMTAGGLAGARFGQPIGERLASDDLYIPTVHLDEQFRFRSRTPFARDTSEARIYSNLKESIVMVTGSSRQGDTIVGNRESGFFVDQSGQVMTALHGVKGADQIQVHTADGNTFAAVLESRDLANDLALLKVTDSTPRDRFKPLTLGTSSGQIAQGSAVFGLGYPSPTLRSRTLFLSPGKFLRRDTLLHDFEIAKNSTARQQAGENLKRKVLQGEMHIQSGMSGGPLVDRKGQVLGLITGRSQNQGQLPSIGKATPLDALIRLYKSSAGAR